MGKREQQREVKKKGFEGCGEGKKDVTDLAKKKTCRADEFAASVQDGKHGVFSNVKLSTNTNEQACGRKFR